MKKNIIFILLISAIFLSGCSLNANNNQPITPANPINPSADTQLQNEINRLTSEIDALKKEQVDYQLINQQAPTQNSFKTYFNEELGITFNYPNEWPEPVFIKKKYSNGGYFDNHDQWEIVLGEFYKNALEGRDVYFASIRGFYSQAKEEIMDEINSDKNQGSLWFKDQFDNKQGFYVVYGEAGLVGVKNIMFFGQNGKTVKVQSISDRFDADIYSVALSIRFLK